MNKVVFNDKSGIQEGVDILCQSIKSTAGPKGRNVIIAKKFGASEITNDGVTVARGFESLGDPIQDMGAHMVKEVCSDTEDMAGDGTTTAAILFQAIVNGGVKTASLGSDVIAVKRGMEKATAAIVQALDKMALPVAGDADLVRKVATISTNNDKFLGSMISKAFDTVGEDGIITVEEGNKRETELRLLDGLMFERGYSHPFFINDDRREQVVIEDPYIVVTDSNLMETEEVNKILTTVPQGEHVLIVSNGIAEGILHNLVLINSQGKFKVTVVKTPGHGDSKIKLCQDLCAAIGATFVTKDSGLSVKELDKSQFGRAKKVIIDQNTTTVIGGRGDKEVIEARKDAIKEQLKISDLEDYERTALLSRLGSLSGSVAILKVGSSSETELKEKIRRLDDALAATRSAIQEGIVPGGGIALLTAKNAIEELATEGQDEELGAKIIFDAITKPFETILDNGGYNPQKVLVDMEKAGPGFGMNVKTGEIVNLLEDGVIDPVKVTKSALMNASSVASMLITTDAIVYTPKTEEE